MRTNAGARGTGCSSERERTYQVALVAGNANVALTARVHRGALQELHRGTGRVTDSTVRQWCLVQPKPRRSVRLDDTSGAD